MCGPSLDKAIFWMVSFKFLKIFFKFPFYWVWPCSPVLLLPRYSFAFTPHIHWYFKFLRLLLWPFHHFSAALCFSGWYPVCWLAQYCHLLTYEPTDLIGLGCTILWLVLPPPHSRRIFQWRYLQFLLLLSKYSRFPNIFIIIIIIKSMMIMIICFPCDIY